MFAALSAVPGAALVRQLANDSPVGIAEEMLESEGLRVVGGHLAFSPGHVLKPGLGYFTVLRDPVERALSVYLHARHHEVAVPGTYVDVAQRSSFEAFVQSDVPGIVDMISEYYTRHFAAPVVDSASIEDKAARRLADYEFVGVFDRLEDSLLLFYAINGWTPGDGLPMLNAAPRADAAMTPALRARLVALNRGDLALWKQAQEQFARQLRGFLRRAGGVSPTPSSGQAIAPAARPADASLVPPAVPASGSLRFGNELMRIVIVETFRGDEPASQFFSGEEVTLRVTVFSYIDVENVTIGISILDLSRRVVFGTNLALLGRSFRAQANHEYRCEFTIKLDIGAGEYVVQAAVHTGATHTENCFDWIEPAATFAVAGFMGQPFAGIANLRCNVEIHGEGARPLTDFRARLWLEHQSPQGVVRVGVRNDGSDVWPADGTLPVHLSYRWIDDAGNALPIEGDRFQLPASLPPGGSATVEFLRPPVPDQATTFRVTLVQELVSWFDQVGGPSLDIMMEK